MAHFTYALAAVLLAWLAFAGGTSSSSNHPGGKTCDRVVDDTLAYVGEFVGQFEGLALDDLLTYDERYPQWEPPDPVAAGCGDALYLVVLLSRWGEVPADGDAAIVKRAQWGRDFFQFGFEHIPDDVERAVGWHEDRFPTDGSVPPMPLVADELTCDGVTLGAAELTAWFIDAYATVWETTSGDFDALDEVGRPYLDEVGRLDAVGDGLGCDPDQVYRWSMRAAGRYPAEGFLEEYARSLIIMAHHNLRAD